MRAHAADWTHLLRGSRGARERSRRVDDVLDNHHMLSLDVTDHVHADRVSLAAWRPDNERQPDRPPERLAEVRLELFGLRMSKKSVRTQGKRERRDGRAFVKHCECGATTTMSSVLHAGVRARELLKSRRRAGQMHFSVSASFLTTSAATCGPLLKCSTSVSVKKPCARGRQLAFPRAKAQNQHASDTDCPDECRSTVISLLVPATCTRPRVRPRALDKANAPRTFSPHRPLRGNSTWHGGVSAPGRARAAKQGRTGASRARRRCRRPRALSSLPSCAAAAMASGPRQTACSLRR